MINEDIISNSLPRTSSLKICEHESNCPRQALAPCHPGSKYLCLKHLNEHNELNILQTDQLSDELNSLTDYLSNLNTQKSVANARNELNLWKKQALGDIDQIYEFHSNEIDHFETELNNRLQILKESFASTISDLKTQLSYFKKIEEISQQDLLFIENNFNQFRQSLQSIQCEISIEIKNISLKNLIHIHNIFSYDRQSINTTQIQAYRTISTENMKRFISSKKNETVLWLDNQKKLYYIDQYFQTHLLTVPQMTSNQRKTKIDIEIIDIKWCSFAEVFLILFQRYLLTFDPKTHKFTPISITRYKDYPFHCITCLNNSTIYISYSTSGICIESWKYDNSINECIKRWDCLTNDKNEWISNMNTNSALQIGLLIRKGSTIYRRFELRDEQLNFLKKIQLDNDYIDAFFPFRSHHWFLKSLSGKYYIYSIETNQYYLSSFDFPFGLEEFGMNTIVIGTKQEGLIYCDM